MRARLIGLVNDGLSARSAARVLPLSPSTAVKGFSDGDEPGLRRRGSWGRGPGAPLNADRDFLNALMEAKPDITLAAAQARLMMEQGPAAGLSAVSRVSQREGWRFKGVCSARGRTTAV